MKIFLILSLIANVILGVLYFQEKSRPPIERIIMEKTPAKIIREKVMVEKNTTPGIKKKKKIESDGTTDFDVEGSMVSEDYEEAVENLEAAKKDFLLGQLGLSEEKLKKEGELRSQFIRTTSKIYEKYQMGEVSIADRRRILDLEEELHQKVVNLYGKNNWEKFRKFQINYNKQVIKRVKEDNSPAILMGP